MTTMTTFLWPLAFHFDICWCYLISSLCSAVQYFWGRRSFQIRYAAHFLHGLAMILLRESLSVRSFLIPAMTRYSGFFQLSLVTRFACDIGQLARIWIEFHLGSSPSAFSGFVNVSQPAAYFTACYTVPPCWRDPIRSKQLSTVAIWLSVWTLSCHCPVKLST